MLLCLSRFTVVPFYRGFAVKTKVNEVQWPLLYPVRMGSGFFIPQGLIHPETNSHRWRACLPSCLYIEASGLCASLGRRPENNQHEAAPRAILDGKAIVMSQCR